MTDSASL
ncbi:hypothetical protein D046_8499, partial [Vibrio parahaemolyticus V-223/04]